MPFSPSHILLLLLVALVVLGPDKLPGAARQAGKALAEFRKISSAVQSQVDEALKTTEPAAAPLPPPEPVPLPKNDDVADFRLIDGGAESPTPSVHEPDRSPAQPLPTVDMAPEIPQHGDAGAPPSAPSAGELSPPDGERTPLGWQNHGDETSK